MRVLVALAFACSGLAAPVLAQQPAEEAQEIGVDAFSIDAELGIASDYRFRGISRSDEDPAVHASITAGHESGLYAGLRATSLAGIDTFRALDPGFGDLGDAEIDLFAGYGAPIGDGFEIDAGIQYYWFAGGDGPTDYVEPYGSLSYLIGPAFATVGAKYAPSQDAIGNEDMLYLFGQVDVAIPFRPWRFNAVVGRQDWGAFGSYWTWSVGAEHRLRLGDLPPADLGLRYVDTDLPAVAGQDGGLVASLKLRF